MDGSKLKLNGSAENRWVFEQFQARAAAVPVGTVAPAPARRREWCFSTSMRLGEPRKRATPADAAARPARPRVACAGLRSSGIKLGCGGAEAGFQIALDDFRLSAESERPLELADAVKLDIRELAAGR